MSDKRDLGGSLVTDYSKSPIAPERARKLNLAELDYINGMADEDSPGELLWPSYPELAAKYELPIRVVQEQAAKHKWVSRREQRKTSLLVFKNKQLVEQYKEMDRQLVDIMQDNVNTATFVVHRLLYEQRRLAENAIAIEQARIAQGELDAVERSGIRPSEIEAVMRTAENVEKISSRLQARINNMTLVQTPLEPPKLIQTVEQEQEENKEAMEVALPQATVLEIYQEMRAIEEARTKLPKTIYGELDYDDEDEAESDEASEHE